MILHVVHGHVRLVPARVPIVVESPYVRAIWRGFLGGLLLSSPLLVWHVLGW